eukprot:354432-Chlamydomonas_euryale.AAC.2
MLTGNRLGQSNGGFARHHQFGGWRVTTNLGLCGVCGVCGSPSIWEVAGFAGFAGPHPAIRAATVAVTNKRMVVKNKHQTNSANSVCNEHPNRVATPRAAVGKGGCPVLQASEVRKLQTSPTIPPHPRTARAHQCLDAKQCGPQPDAATPTLPVTAQQARTNAWMPSSVDPSPNTLISMPLVTVSTTFCFLTCKRKGQDEYFSCWDADKDYIVDAKGFGFRV